MRGLIIGSVVLVTIIIFFYGFRIVASGIPLSEMDWNLDNDIDIFEIIRSKDIGVKKIGGCKEYYHLKDGVLVKKDCD